MSYSVGIIGTGFGAKVHLPSFQFHKDFDVKIIAGRNKEKTANIAEEHNVDYTTNWVDLLIKDLDVIAITTPPYHHFTMAREALDSGKHILLEKPTTTSALEARELVQLSNDSGLTAMMCHEFRWMPHTYYLHDLIQSGKIGKVNEIHYQSFVGWAASSDTPPFGWLWDSVYDGGVLGAVGSHLVDQVRFLTGLEFREVMGSITTRTKQRKNRQSDEYHQVTADDGFSMLYTLEQDVIGEMIVSSTTSPALPTRLILSGSEGTLYTQDSKVYFASLEGEYEELQIPDKFQLDMELQEKDRRIPPFLKLLDHFSAAINEQTSLSPSVTDGWRNQLVIDAVRKSHAYGTRVKITDYL